MGDTLIWLMAWADLREEDGQCTALTRAMVQRTLVPHQHQPERPVSGGNHGGDWGEDGGDGDDGWGNGDGGSEEDPEYGFGAGGSGWDNGNGWGYGDWGGNDGSGWGDGKMANGEGGGRSGRSERGDGAN